MAFDCVRVFAALFSFLHTTNPFCHFHRTKRHHTKNQSIPYEKKFYHRFLLFLHFFVCSFSMKACSIVVISHQKNLKGKQIQKILVLSIKMWCLTRRRQDKVVLRISTSIRKKELEAFFGICLFSFSRFFSLKAFIW